MTRIKDEHPSYGMIGISRVFGNVNLFGSANKHQHFFSLTICKAHLEHELGKDWYFGGKDIIEVHLSPAQFVNTITTMNIGNGVPCTLSYVDKEKIPVCPEQSSEAKRTKVAFTESVNKIVDELDDTVNEIKDILLRREPYQQKALTKSDRTFISEKIDKLVRLFKHTAPFMLDQFERATTKMEAESKADIEAYAERLLIAMGLEAIEVNKDIKRLEENTTTQDSLPNGLEDSEPLGRS